MLRNVFMVYLFASVILTMLICSYVLLRIRTAYMKTFFLLCLAVSIYSFGYLMEISSTHLEQMFFWNQVQYLGVPFAAALWYLVALLYTHRIHQLKKGMIATLFLIPLLTFFLRLTNASHHLYYSDLHLQVVGNHPFLYLSKGPWYFVQGLYTLVLMVAILALFASEYRHSEASKRQRSLLLLISSTLPFVGLILILADFLEWGLDYSILLFPLSLILIVIAITKYDFLEVRSLARSEVFEHGAEALLLLDMDFRIIDFNDAAVGFLKHYGLQRQTGPLDTALPDQEELKNTLKASETIRFHGTGGRVHELTTRIMKDRRGHDLAMIKTISDITERVAIQERLEEMASTDELTQLHNRRHFMELAEKEFHRAVRYGEGFCILMIDIDRFKQINDQGGHAAGDTVIRTMGSLLRDRFRSTDLLGRLGGEEFVVLMPRCELKEALLVAENFCRQVAETEILYGGKAMRITISMGVSPFDKEAAGIDDILQLADQALYQAKSAGRNRVFAVLQSCPSMNRR